jgi:citrate lyase subunit beta/citryl-CoA lyase
VLTARTILDVPGHSAHKLQKGLDSDADALMVDLEDGVPADDRSKMQARSAIAECFTGRDRQVVLRVNEVDSPWFADDVRLAVEQGFSAIVVPKAQTLNELCLANEILADLDDTAQMKLWPIIETPSLLLHLERSEVLPDRLGALIAGMVDFTFSVAPSAFLSPQGFDGRAAIDLTAHLRLRVLVAAAAHGLRAVDALTVQSVTSPDLARVEAERARSAGFRSIIVLHPAQIAPANQGFAPSGDEIDRARALLAIGESAREQGYMSANRSGSIVLPQHVKAAQSLLESLPETQIDSLNAAAAQ